MTMTYYWKKNQGRTKSLSKLGNKNAEADGKLECFSITTFGVPVITLECTEFTCRCPVTNQPDWATITIVYQPDVKVVESKSLKLYLETFRDVGIFHEHLTQRILTDFVAMVAPSWCDVTAKFNSRGGIAIEVTVQYYKEKENEDL